MKKTYTLFCVWQKSGYLEIEAHTLQEAIEEAYIGGLPEKGYYVEDSFIIDKEQLKENYPEEAKGVEL